MPGQVKSGSIIVDSRHDLNDRIDDTLVITRFPAVITNTLNCSKLWFSMG